MLEDFSFSWLGWNIPLFILGFVIAWTYLDKSIGSIVRRTFLGLLFIVFVTSVFLFVTTQGFFLLAPLKYLPGLQNIPSLGLGVLVGIFPKLKISERIPTYLSTPALFIFGCFIAFSMSRFMDPSSGIYVDRLLAEEEKNAPILRKLLFKAELGGEVLYLPASRTNYSVGLSSERPGLVSTREYAGLKKLARRSKNGTSPIKIDTLHIYNKRSDTERFLKRCLIESQGFTEYWCRGFPSPTSFSVKTSSNSLNFDKRLEAALAGPPIETKANNTIILSSFRSNGRDFSFVTFPSELFTDARGNQVRLRCNGNFEDENADIGCSTEFAISENLFIKGGIRADKSDLISELVKLQESARINLRELGKKPDK